MIPAVIVLALLGAAMVGICIAFIDRPVALYFAAHRGGRHIFQLMAAPSLLPLPCGLAYLGYAMLRKLRSGGTPPHNPVWLMMSVATLAATAAKDELKWMFGGPWPGTWLHTGIYAFRPFTDSFMFGAFPSGHTSYITAPLCVLAVAVPKFRLAAGFVILTVMTGLVGAGYHFIGDVIAGFFTGLAAAAATLVMMRGKTPDFPESHQGSSRPV